MMMMAAEKSVWITLLIGLLAVVVVVHGEDTEEASEEERPVLNVTSILVEPYLSENLTASLQNVTGNDLYEGFIKDLLDELAEFAKFDYEIRLSADGKYGGEEDGEWTGMIGEVMRGEADLAAAPLIVTLTREKAVDFTFPFMRSEAVVLMLNRHPSQFPYIHTIEDLVNQDIMKYGVVKDGAIAKELKASTVELHERMWMTMQNDTAASFKENNNEGVHAARVDSDYAFILESTSADFVLKHEPCNMEAIPAGFFNRQYAIAVPNQSELRDKLNEALIEMKYNGKMAELIEKWMGEDECSGANMGTFSLLVLLVSVLAVFNFNS